MPNPGGPQGASGKRAWLSPTPRGRRAPAPQVSRTTPAAVPWPHPLLTARRDVQAQRGQTGTPHAVWAPVPLVTVRGSPRSQ